MLSRRREALLELVDLGGEESKYLKQLDRMLRHELFRAADPEAKRLRFLVEDAVLGIEEREPPYGSDCKLRRLVHEYQKQVGAHDLARIGLDPYRCQVVFDRPRLFISHRHIDEVVAAALVALLQAAYELDKSDLRCTSVRPHRLSVGDRIGECLRTDIRTAETVLGLLAPDTQESSSVLFELGAAWSQERPTYPLLVRGATSANIPPFIRGLHALRLADQRDCEELLDVLEQNCSLHRRRGVGGDVADKIDKLAKAAA